MSFTKAKFNELVNSLIGVTLSSETRKYLNSLKSGRSKVDFKFISDVTIGHIADYYKGKFKGKNTDKYLVFHMMNTVGKK